eukprot:3072323-Pyramimonas_sp.AAC.1
MGMVSRRWPSVPLSVPPWTSRTQMRPSGLAGMGLRPEASQQGLEAEVQISIAASATWSTKCSCWVMPTHEQLNSPT